jgi:hypothetical protein
MYIIFGSKKNVYSSVPLDGVETVESYQYKFYGKVILDLNIGKVTNKKSKIKVIDETEKNCVNLISVKFFGKFNNIEEARKEIKTLVSYGDLKTDMKQIF